MALKLYNSLTKKKDIFAPANGKTIKWYTCGPTVYDESHIGHARTYITLDVMRRVLRDYFGYNIIYQMNITDIDDKIINKSIDGNIKAVANFYEKTFFDDMEKLNVEEPDFVTRVTEFIPEIIEYIQKIIDNGFAYEKDGSIYFDTVAFSKNNHYSKLRNEKVKDETANFVLWKKSEGVYWNAIFNGVACPGRPGWHIECSTMANDILGKTIDIHSGGIDLAFPHHDNEIAQSEAYHGHDDWVKYFIHIGHLNIDGLKMSKSLKNFITIKEILKSCTPNQLRIMFLHHNYHSSIDYTEDAIKSAISFENLCVNFLSNVFSSDKNDDNEFMEKFVLFQKKIDDALCDSIDTLTVINCIRETIDEINFYMHETNYVNPAIIAIAKYIKRVLGIFGLDFDKKSKVTDDRFLDVILTFRNDIRNALKNKDPRDIYRLCDELRDVTLPAMGVKLEDKANGKMVVRNN